MHFIGTSTNHKDYDISTVVLCRYYGKNCTFPHHMT